MNYWISNESVAICPVDHHSLKAINFQRSGIGTVSAKMCDFCNSVFLPYINADVAVTCDDISIDYLNGTEKKKIKNIRAREREEQRKRELEQERKARELLERRKRELKAKRLNFIAQIKAVFESDYLSSERFFKENNKERLLSWEDFDRLQGEFIEKWFAGHTPEGERTPDKDQRAAIGATRKNIEVVARAGSGKTTTIINRFRFLTEHCGVDASSVLLLAFNRKAAEELREKIEKLLSTYPKRLTGMPHIMTFHALAYSIVHPQENLIYDDAGLELSRTIQSIIDDKLRNVIWVAKIRYVMLSHFKDNWEEIKKWGRNLTTEEQLLYRRSLPNQTLKGEYVKSFGEKAIANILFEYNIEYAYEKTFYWTDGSPYRPDFTVLGSNTPRVIIEYFGLAGDPEYDRQIQRKRNFWSTKGIPLIELYPTDVANGLDSLTVDLLGRLKKEGVKYRKLSENEIWERIKDRAIDEFTKAMVSFVGRCRKKDLSSAALRELIRGYTSELGTEKVFLEIAADVYDEYLRKLPEEHLEDFDGLISRAKACIQDGKTAFDKREQRGDLKDLSFIMIDEYQDFSYLFDCFLDSILSVCPDASLFCVGDDWQAINAFAGSDVQYFQQFTERYVDSRRYPLNMNYRSKQEIVSAGTRLMSPGDDCDPIKASKPGYGIIRIGYLSEFISSPVEQSIHGSDYLTPSILRLVSSILYRGKNVVLLARTNDRLPLAFTSRVDVPGARTLDLFLETIRSFFPPDKRERITASTTHKYKGKEKDAVIILDAVVNCYPLIHPAWIFQRVFGDTVDKLIAEEKRLFYVAISRPKDELYILTMKSDESPFLFEIGDIDELYWDDYPPLRTGDAKIKIEIRNQDSSDSFPTMSIKELLKESQYYWDPTRKAWYRYCPRESFDMATILNQPWAQAANHVVLIQYDENENAENAYLFADGEILTLSLRK